MVLMDFLHRQARHRLKFFLRQVRLFSQRRAWVLRLVFDDMLFAGQIEAGATLAKV